jgi:hypothetical protein
VVYYLGIETEEERKMKHKHYEMIVAKAANMDLVVLFKASNGYKNWIEAENDLMPSFHPNTEYFLCLPQHKGPCLHWLSGGSLQDLFEDSWTSVGDFEGEDWVEADNMFMNEEYQFRVKPKKEKRWIIWNENQDSYHCTFLVDPSDKYEANFKFSIHEIKVEV